MAVLIDSKKGKEVARTLYEFFETKGIHGHTEMPEDVIPNGMVSGSLEHSLFIALTVSIDYQRDAPTLWENSRRTYEHKSTRYLFDPKKLHSTYLKKIIEDMQKYKLSKKPRKDAEIWKTIGVTFYKKWQANPIRFLQDCARNSETILRRLKSDTHMYNGRCVYDFPYLRGNKIGPLWLRMLRDNIGLKKIRNLEKVPIPVDIHIARATLATGVIRGCFSRRLEDLFSYIRETWFRSVKDLEVKGRPMIALDVDEPLWHLSKYGCSKRDKVNGNCPVYDSCEARELCIRGKIKLGNYMIDLDT